jgi:hypothetical protein
MANPLKGLASGPRKTYTLQEVETMKEAANQQKAARLQSMTSTFETQFRSDPNVGSASVNKKVFEEFIRQTEKREQLLLDATEEQNDLFKELETTIQKLKDANSQDSKALRQTIDKLSKKLEKTPETKAKQNIQKLIPAQKEVKAKEQSKYFSNVQNIFKGGLAGPSPGAPLPATPANYSLYEDAGLLRSNEDVEDQMQEQQSGSGILSGLISAIPDIIYGLLGLKGLKALSRLLPGGAKAATALASKAVPGVAKGMFQKLGSKIGTSGLGKLGKGIFDIGRSVATKTPLGMAANLAYSGYTGYQEYKESGDIGRALSGPTGTFLGGMVPGGIIAKTFGALGGEALGKGAYDIVTTPALQNTQSEDIQTESQMNEDLNKPVMAPNIVVTPPTVEPAMQQQNTLIAPRGEIRPTESALSQYMKRESFY